MRIVQRDLVVLQSRAPVERFDDPARFAENDLSGGRIPFVGVRRADVNFDGTLASRQNLNELPCSTISAAG